jgi:flagellar assembly protein FliH
MSLSKQNTPDIQPLLKVTGRVIVGGIKNNTATERTLTELMTSREKRPIWTPDEEMAFLDRVTQKAREKAKLVLAEALAEAGGMKTEARERGYADGRAQGYEEGYAQGYSEAQQLAEQQLSAAHQEMADSLAQALSAVQEGSEVIWGTYRQDLVDLLRMCVEKITGAELTANRRAILQGLLFKAVEQLEGHRGLTIRVHPEDEPTMAAIIEQSRDRYPALDAWRLKNDSQMLPGGLIVESEQGKMDSTLEGRWSVLKSVLDELTLPFVYADAPQEDPNQTAQQKTQRPPTQELSL